MSSTRAKQPNLNRRGALKLVGLASAAAVLPRPSRALAGRRAHLLETRLVREFGLRTPLVSAGMGFVGLTDLTTAVSNAGALGVYGVGGEPVNVMVERLQAIKRRTRAPFGVDFIIAPEATGGSFTTQAHIDEVASARVPLVVFHWNLPTRAWVRQLRAAGATVWMQTGDINVALQAVALGIEGIVAQGRSAGGHNRNSTIATWELVYRMRRTLPEEIFILAAGGVADGDSLVRAILAGADGGWAGSVFAASTESYAHAGYKARLVRGGANDTTFTTVFGPEWAGAQQRVLRNRATSRPGSTTPAVIGNTKLFPGVLDVPYEMPKFSAVVPTRDTTGDLDEMDMPAGAISIQKIRAVRPASQIVRDFIDESRDAADRGDVERLPLDQD